MGFRVQASEASLRIVPKKPKPGYVELLSFGNVSDIHEDLKDLRSPRRIYVLSYHKTKQRRATILEPTK